MPVQDMDNDQASTDQNAANVPSSDGNGASGGSFDASKLQAVFEKLATKLEEVDARTRALQGDKDRAVTKTNKEVETLAKQFAEIEKLVKGGMDVNAAVDEYSFRETVKELKSQLGNATSVSAPPVGNGEGRTMEVAKVFTELGLDLKDPRVLVEMQKSYKDPDALELAAYRLSKVIASAPNPTFSQSPALTGASAKTDVTSKIARLQELQKRPTLYRDEISRLTKELDAVNWGS
jgi:hypothetical protein